MIECVFCKIVKGSIPAEKIYETGKILAFLDINAVNKGDALVITKKHYKEFIETPDGELAELIKATRKITEAVGRALKPDGYNILINNKKAAGQVIMHIHAHIIPRFAGDKVEHWHKKSVPSEELKKMRREIINELRL